jgi:small nuclear ribonucleoprotein (snRNP)-like protein
MSIEVRATQFFNREISQAIGQFVKVSLDYENKFYRGKLVGVEMTSLTICLENAIDERNNRYAKIFIRGNSWDTITMEGEPFPLEKLAERIRKVLPGEEVAVNEDRILLLGGKLIITEKGVEGKGPTKDRIQKVFETFVEELKAVKK